MDRQMILEKKNELKMKAVELSTKAEDMYREAMIDGTDWRDILLADAEYAYRNASAAWAAHDTYLQTVVGG